MSAITSRDELFSELHAQSLKPAGFKKKGRWAVRAHEEVTHTFFLRSSRFGSSRETTFWIDVQVFSERWHQLLFAPEPYKGPAEGTPCLVLRGLPSWSWPAKAMRLSSGSDLARLREDLLQSARDKALPYLERCQTFTSLLECLLESPDEEFPFLQVAGLFRLLGRDDQARSYMQRAKAAAAHENALRFLELREQSIWRQHAA